MSYLLRTVHRGRGKIKIDNNQRVLEILFELDCEEIIVIEKIKVLVYMVIWDPSILDNLNHSFCVQFVYRLLSHGSKYVRYSGLKLVYYLIENRGLRDQIS